MLYINIDNSELGKELSKVLGHNQKSGDEVPQTRRTYVDPHPRSDSIVSDDDEIKFKRILTKYMEHELAQNKMKR